MAEKSENFMQVSEITSMKMAVIEHRAKGGHEWFVGTIYDSVHEIKDGFLREKCRSLARRFPTAEYRWRYGWLALEPSDKCETFKSE